jgi:hypothetical protein
MSSRRSTAVALAALTAGALAIGPTVGPADAVEPSKALKTQVAKQAGGPFGHRVRVNLGAGDVKNLYLRAKPLKAAPFTAHFTGESGPTDINIKYFKRNGKDITADVEDSGYSLKINPPKSKRLRVKLSAPSGGIVECLIFTNDDPKGFSNAIVAVNQPLSGCPT